MSLSELNLSLFNDINAPANANEWLVNFAIFIANDTLYLMILVFAYFWLRGSNAVKQQIMKAFIFTSVAIILAEVISYFFYHPRPFVMHVGRTLIEHAPNASFPSTHMLIFSSIAFAYCFSPQRQLGVALMFLAWAVAWSRVYLGVHFPIDMIGAFFLAFIINAFGLGLWNKYQNIIMQWILQLHQMLFKAWINKGYIK
ncbi:phosphatase PAP2 family protein [Acinetobacter sp. ANC 4648]|uniref:phosphatase PAP2 family protein n=1 Tax=Acinetobacter sp. ANC 4648 TaxID=1977875 RepID=UPI000A357942|nr:phosphatase PAP2 family protein [Acinetobacter sp. ANC 4648]OTG83595.1 undecaprenyl-diphosphatase [Acinetobacter sp. ANC 4648]